MAYSEFLQTAIEVVDKARELLNEHRKKYIYKPYQFETKDDTSPVTETDLRVESVIRELIGEKHPEHRILGEEYGETEGSNEFTWTIDPIDGTKQFITGVPLYSTLISLCHHGIPVIGVMDFPAVDERWIGLKGAKTTLNNIEVSTRACASLSEALMSTSSTEPVPQHKKMQHSKVIESTKWRIYGAAAYAYGCLATGRLDLSVDSGEMRPIDYCGKVPIIEGAGGVITDWEGNPLTINSGNSIIAAGDKRVYEQAMRILQD